MVVYISCCMLGKILENFGFCDMCQNVLCQLDCRIFRPTMSLEQNHENVWFFACSWYKFIKLTSLIHLKSWLKNIGMALVINGCAHSGWRNLRLAVSRKEINGINWFLVFWY